MSLCTKTLIAVVVVMTAITSVALALHPAEKLKSGGQGFQSEWMVDAQTQADIRSLS